MNNSAIDRSVIGGIVVGALLVAAILVALLRLDLHDDVLRLLEWLDAQGLWAPFLFIMLMAAVVVLLLPGVLFTTGAGFVFGVVQGSICVVVGTTLGAAGAFLVARRLFGKRAARYVLEHPKLKLLDSELGPRGWQVVLLSRLVPFFPGKLSNYFFGLTSVSLRGFVAATFLGIIPFSVNNVYLGALTAELATRGARTADFSAGQWALYGTGLLVALCGAVCLGRIAWRALNKQTKNDGAAS
ncbi:MAG: TVP38/TMEM64 family protein [Chromatiales bacterium]